ncbi:hypothetical protein PGIGA_G00162290 [Pangasianodon gigas]|uniref:Uncharacterized protein n=1 Tax=Pangasianodon gigas TaxID=30993 RepID=A0ACC5XRQ7_PANGG|nr:hypothetical protein [Pangasianodon gigas]
MILFAGFYLYCKRVKASRLTPSLPKSCHVCRATDAWYHTGGAGLAGNHLGLRSPTMARDCFHRQQHCDCADLQASRAILVIAPLVALVAILASIAGGKCTNCLDQSTAKARVATAAGVFFLIAGLLSLVPPSWMANAVIRDFYNPLVAQSQKRELGASIFICWGAAVLMVIGGGLLCTSWPSSRGKQTGHYKPASQTSRERAAYV